MQMRKFITLEDFQVLACIVSNVGSYGNLGHQGYSSIRGVQCRDIHICSNLGSGHLGCCSCSGMGSRGWSRVRMGGLGGRRPGLGRRRLASPASPVTSLCVSQKQEAGREGCGEGDREEPAEHWWPPQPEKPGVQLLAGCDGLSLEHHGDDGGAQVLRRLKETSLEVQVWLQLQASPWFCHQQLKQTGWPARQPSRSCGRLPARELARPPF